MKSKLLFAMFMIVCSSNLSAQVTTFQRYYDTLNSYYSNCVQQTLDGGFILCGSAFDNFSAQDGVIMKTDSAGEITWVKTFGGQGTQGVTHIEQIHDGNYIALGVNDEGGSVEKIWLLKLSPVGDTIWTRIFSYGNSRTRPTRFVLCFDGGFAITGYFDVGGSGNLDAFLLKVDTSGILQWSKLYGGVYSESPFDIKQTTDSGFIMVGGGPDLSIPPNADVFILRTNSVGDSLWSKNYGYSNVDVANAVQQTADNGFIIVGYSWNLIGNNYDVYLIKTDSFGDTLWTRLLGDNFENTGASIQITTNGDYFIEGTTATTSNNYDFYVVKSDSSGNELWSKSYGSISSEILYYAIQCNDGGLALVGGRTTDAHSLYFVKTDGQGSVIGIDEPISEVKNQIILFPNPLSLRSNVLIPESIDLNGMSFTLCDNVGRILLNQKVNRRSFSIERNNISSGVYFLMFSNQIYHQIIKIIVQ